MQFVVNIQAAADLNAAFRVTTHTSEEGELPHIVQLPVDEENSAREEVGFHIQA